MGLATGRNITCNCNNVNCSNVLLQFSKTKLSIERTNSIVYIVVEFLIKILQNVGLASVRLSQLVT